MAIGEIAQLIYLIPIITALIAYFLPDEVKPVKVLFYMISFLTLFLNVGIAYEIADEEVVDTTADVLVPLLARYWQVMTVTATFLGFYFIILFLQILRAWGVTWIDDLRRRRVIK